MAYLRRFAVYTWKARVFWPVCGMRIPLRLREHFFRSGLGWPSSRHGGLPQLSSKLTPKDLKQHLVADGFQVFRTLGSRVVLADRVRDNLIMDSGVAVVCESPHAIRAIFRAHARDYPTEPEGEMFERVRALAAASLSDQFSEVEFAVVPVEQPGRPGVMLDTRYEVTFERGGLRLQELNATLRALLAMKKVV